MTRRSSLLALPLLLGGCSPLERDTYAAPTPEATTLSSTPESPDQQPTWTEKLVDYFNAVRGDPYPLDDVPRRIPEDQPLPCIPKDLEIYRGTDLKLSPITVYPALVPRLQRLERIAQELGKEVYGRAPVRLRHVGGYACRRSTVRKYRLSEHALGNAIDIVGFDFPALPRPPRTAAPAAPPDPTPAVPSALRGPFQVTVLRHWESKGGPAADLHRAFLRRFAERIERDAVFRVLLGPSHPGHQDHLHFDMSPWTYSHL